VAGAAYYQQGFAYLLSFVERFWIWFMVIPLLFLGKGMKLNTNLKIVVFYFTSMTLFFSCYVVYVGGDFMDMFRFLVPVLPFFFFLVQEGFRGMFYYLQPFLNSKQRISLIVAEILLVGLTLFILASPSRETNQIWHRKDMDSIGLMREDTRLWSKVGQMFGRMAKPGETLSTSAAGAIPYYSGLYTIDELGLTLASLDALRVRTVHRAGHSKRVTDEFLLTKRPTYFVGHPKLYDDYQPARGVWGYFSQEFLRHGYKPMVYKVRISEGEAKYLYCLTLNAPPSDRTDQETSNGSKPGDDK
jgi:arabinofuranosyltransferase